jgi:DNA-binding NtrC family response regulator
MRDVGEDLLPQDSEMEMPYPPSGPEGALACPEVAPLILVVDDDEGCRKVLLDYLKVSRFACRGVSNAYDALQILRQGYIDLVISDIEMYGKDGVELMRETHRDYPDIPFIIITGCAPDYSYEDVINAGASDFIAKPFSLEELKIKISRIGKRQQHCRGLTAAGLR